MSRYVHPEKKSLYWHSWLKLQLLVSNYLNLLGLFHYTLECWPRRRRRELFRLIDYINNHTIHVVIGLIINSLFKIAESMHVNSVLLDECVLFDAVNTYSLNSFKRKLRFWWIIFAPLFFVTVFLTCSLISLCLFMFHWVRISVSLGTCVRFWVFRQ